MTDLNPIHSVGLVFGHVASNLGDIAINEGIRELCSRHLPRAGLEVLLRRPNPKLLNSSLSAMEPYSQVLVEPYVAKPRRSSELKASLGLLRALTRPERWANEIEWEFPDLVIGNGGEHFFESPSGDNVQDLLWRVIPLVAASASGSRVIQMPSTFGPFRTEAGRVMLRAAAAAAGELVARDSASARALESEGLKTTMVLDPAFMLPRLQQEADSSKRLAIVPRLENYGMRIGTAASNYSLAIARRNGYSSTAAYSWATRIGDLFLRDGWDVDVYVQTIADRELAHAIADRLASSSPERIRIYEPESVSQYRKLLRRSSAVVSARFHANILALAMGVPAVGVYHASHGSKMPGLYDLLGLPGYAVSINGAPGVDIARKIHGLVGGIQEDLPAAMARLDDLVASTDRWFKEALAAPPKRPGLAATRLALGAVVERVLREHLENTDFDEGHGSELSESLAQILDRLQVIEGALGRERDQMKTATKTRTARVIKTAEGEENVR